MKESLYDKKIYILFSFGRSGLDFLHSRLDSHPEILIIPNFSFYRLIYQFKKKYNFHQTKEILNKKVIKKFVNFIYNNNRNNLETEFLFSQKKKNKFIFYIYDYFKKLNHEINVKNLFLSFNYAFAKLHNIKIDKIKIIISHEHSVHFLDNYKLHFKNVKYIAMIRNPLNIYASIKQLFIKREMTLKSIHLDFQFAQILRAFEFIKNNKTIIIKNEILNLDIESEISRLAKKLGIKNNPSLKKETYLNKKWHGDSAYLIRKNSKVSYLKKPKSKSHDFHHPINQNNRSLKILDTNEILIIETVFGNLFNYFNYKRMINKTIFNLFKGYLLYFFLYKNEINIINNFNSFIKNILRRFLVLLNKKSVVFWLNIS